MSPGRVSPGCHSGTPEFDSDRAARMLARGASLAATARAVDCPRSTLARRVAQDRVLQAKIEDYRSSTSGLGVPPGGGPPGLEENAAFWETDNAPAPAMPPPRTEAGTARGNGSATGRIGRLQRSLEDAIEREIQQNNLRVILWLAERIKLIDTSDAQTPTDEIKALIDSLTPEEISEFVALSTPSGP